MIISTAEVSLPQHPSLESIYLIMTTKWNYYSTAELIGGEDNPQIHPNPFLEKNIF